jgi:hypothetical protein
MILSILQELQAKNEQLLDRNCVCGIASRRDLFAGPTDVYELRILPNGATWKPPMKPMA